MPKLQQFLRDGTYCPTPGPRPDGSIDELDTSTGVRSAPGVRMVLTASRVVPELEGIVTTIKVQRLLLPPPMGAGS